MSATDIELDRYPTRSDVQEPASPATRASSAPTSTASTQQDDQPPANKEAFESYPEDAWVSVVLPCFVIFSTSVGGVYSYGVFQDALVATGLAPSSTLAWVGSTLGCIQGIAAIPILRFVAAYGPRTMALIGTAFLSLAMLLASFCTHTVGGLVVTQGLMFGIGEAILFLSAAHLPSAYFLRRRNIATGITYAGGGVGGAIFSIVTAQLLKRVSLPWTYRILALIFLVLNLPCALSLKTRAPRVPLRGGAGKKTFDVSLFKDVRFILLAVGTSIAIFPLFVPPFFLPLYGTSLGLSASTGSFILAGFNLASAAGRIGFGVFADSLLGTLNSFVLCLALVGVSTLLIWPLATSLAPLIVFAVINGFCAGGMFSLAPGVVSSVFGTVRLGVAFAMMTSFWTPGYILGSPIAGFLLQAMGGPEKGFGAYRPAIFYSGALSLCAALVVSVVRLKQERRVFRKV
ncbi:hypothetical protein JCM8097_001127 [Rhodosporidiobolus ruineniae]